MIRAMREEDAPLVWELFRDSLGYDCSQDVVRRRVSALSGDPRSVVWVWEDDDGTVQAFIHAQRYDTLHDEGGWNVIALAVAASAQGTGIGRELLSAFEAHVRQAGGCYVRLNSRLERPLAHGFYEHLGYVCDKVQKRFSKQVGVG